MKNLFLLICTLLSIGLCNAQLTCNINLVSPPKGCAPHLIKAVGSVLGNVPVAITIIELILHDGTTYGTAYNTDSITTIVIPPGIYCVRYTVIGTNGDTCVSMNCDAEVYNNPTVNVTFSDIMGEPPLTVQMNAECHSLCGAGLTSFIVDWGCGTAPTILQDCPTQPLSYTYNCGYGCYSPKIIMENSCGCIATYEGQEICLCEQPDVSGYISIDELACGDTSAIVFFNTSALYDSIRWGFGDGTTATSDTSVKSYITPGTYPVQLTVYDSTCYKTIVVDTVRVGNAPLAEFSFEISGDSVMFTNLSDSTHLPMQWFFDDGQSDTTLNPIHVYDTPGTYVVSLILNNNCTDTVQYIVEIAEAPDTIVIGLDDLFFETLQLFPNPANAFCMVKLPTEDKYDLHVVDMLGQTVVNAGQVSKQYQLDISAMPSGTYIVMAYRNGTVTAKERLVVF